MDELIINGVDCTEYATDYGITITYKKRKGRAAGMMLDGTEEEDVLAHKAEIVLDFIPQSREILSGFVKNLYSKKYATVRYFDLREKAYREIEAIYGEVTAKYLFQNVFGQKIWKINSVKLTER